MGKNKNICSKCLEKLYPPTGKNCTRNISTESDEDMGTPRISTQMKKKAKVKDIQLSAQVHATGSPVTGKPDLYKVKRAEAPGHQDHSDSGEVSDSSEEEGAVGQAVNLQILTELKKMNKRLNVVESQVADSKKGSRKKARTDHKLSTVKNCSYEHKRVKGSESSDSSDQESDIPLLSTIRFSKTI